MRNFLIPFFASSDRNLLEQITYITLVSLYPGDIPNYRGMTVGTAITSSFEDSLGNFMARTSNLPILFNPARGWVPSYFRAGRAVIIITNNRKNLGMFANTSIARSTPLSTGTISPKGETRQIFYCLPRYPRSWLPLSQFFGDSFHWKFNR